eukprot:11949037-Alexandrium_andersonii.AAC.1
MWGPGGGDDQGIATELRDVASLLARGPRARPSPAGCPRSDGLGRGCFRPTPTPSQRSGTPRVPR